MLLQDVRAAVGELHGVGERRTEQFRRMHIETIADLLTLVPRRYEDRSRIVTLAEAAAAGEGLVRGEVVGHDYFNRGRRKVLKIVIRDESGSGALVCFGRNFLARSFPVGALVVAYGQFALRYGEIQAASFEAERIDGDGSTPPSQAILPVYPATEGLGQRDIRASVGRALDRYADRIDDEIPAAVRSAERLLPLREALAAIHRPRTAEEPGEGLRRLVYGELFVFQLRLAVEALRRRRRRRRARPEATRRIVSAVRASLPFELTEDQRTVVGEIIEDMRRPWPMSRLLQGDVGSGKTLVALLCAAHAIERGQQVALLVPTELLARQHARSIGALLANTDAHPALMVGSAGAGAKREIAAALTAGEIDLVVGTHALFSEGLEYANLGLVIIDEQHRFGVAQRETIVSRGHAPDVLMMSATPIPRSLALTAFGDSDVSTIHTLPPGRKPVRTHLARMGNERRVYEFVRREVEAGHQAYLVYPAIEESGERGYRSVEEMYRRLGEYLSPYAVGLAHSRLEEAERTTTMERFAAGEIHALVATSVVEVGVDVPNATCMVIEHAEAFGLAALHQLRGRVGRGAAQSYCILVYQEPLSDDGRERLKVMYRSTDGFFIAEEDLRIRGPGELKGSRQSGFLQFRFADIRRDMKTMIAARTRVADILRRDPDLHDVAHENLRRAVETAV